jgi:hypothetical protein
MNQLAHRFNKASQKQYIVKADLILISIFICLHFLIQQNAISWTLYNLPSLGLIMYFLFKAIKLLTKQDNLLFILSSWLISACIGMAMVHIYIEPNQGLKICFMILALGNFFLLYKFLRMDQGRAFGIHILVMLIIAGSMF